MAGAAFDEALSGTLPNFIQRSPPGHLPDSAPGGGGGRSGFRVKGVGFRGLGFRGLGFRGSGFRGVMSRVLGFRGSVSSFGVSCKGSSKLFSSSRVPLMVPLWVLVRVPA